MKLESQKGSIFIYILGAIALAGLLIFTLTNGPQKSATTQQLDELTDAVQSDLKAITAAINECAITYPSKVDANGDGVDDYANPNVPFPLYAAGASGSTGVALNAHIIICPGAPGTATLVDTPGIAGSVFSRQNGQTFRVLDLSAASPIYTVNYLNNGTEGIQLRITRSSSSPLWTEAISRLDGRYSACQAAAVTSAGTCVNGCFYYWIKRLSTSDPTLEPGCP